MSSSRIRRAKIAMRAWPLTVVIAVAALSAALAPALLAKSAGAQGNPKLLLLPIVVHSSEDPEYLRNGLADMLNARFSRIGGLEIIRANDPEPGTTDLRRALELGRKAGADFVLYGSFTRFGQGASLEVQCSPTDKKMARAPLREIFVHSGSIGEIIPDLDELAGKVSRFAKGEDVSSPAPAAPAAASGFAAGDPDVEDLISRIEALEAALTEILESADELGDPDDEGDEDLR